MQVYLKRIFVPTSQELVSIIHKVELQSILPDYASDAQLPHECNSIGKLLMAGQIATIHLRVHLEVGNYGGAIGFSYPFGGIAEFCNKVRKSLKAKFEKTKSPSRPY